MNIQNQFIDVQGIRTHILTTGSESIGDGPGRTVVLLHGGGIDCAELSWGLLIAELARDWRVVAFDWPGYGESDHLKLPYSTDFYIEFLEAFLDQLGIHRASFVGISMGGAVGLGFTLSNSRRVEKLVLVDSYGLQDSVPYARFSYYFVHMPGINEWSWALMRSRAMVRYSLQALLKRPGALTQDLVDRAYQEVTRPYAGMAWMTYQKNEVTQHGPHTCFMDQLDRLDVPVLIIHGSKDTLVPVECARQAHEKIKGSKLHWMEGCGHWSQRDDPESFNRVVCEFLGTPRPDHLG